MPQRSSRREFIKNSAAIGAAVWVGNRLAKAAEESTSPNSKVRYACIGVHNRGRADTAEAEKLGEIAAICDVDSAFLEATSRRPGFREAQKFVDFREMLDTMAGKIDAVTITIPDHMHAPAAAMAMKKGIACFCQKPLTHTVGEARRLQEIAQETGVATMMGNQGTAEDGLRRAAALLKSGTLGRIKEVHVITNRPVWNQGGARPQSDEIPKSLNWDLWLGCAPLRPFALGYHPFAWRGWWDFGTGALGDMACHTFNMPFAGLNLANPKTIQAWTTGHNGDSYPQSSKIQFEFPHPSGEGLLPVWWYDGGNLPDLSLLNGQPLQGGDKPSGAIIVGEDLTLYSPGDYAAKFMLINDKGEEQPIPEVEYERSPGHFQEFHQTITGDRKQAMSNFIDYAGPLTETILLGNLAVYAAATGEGKKIEWDADSLTATNAPEVMSIVHKQYRNGYDEYLR